MEITAFVRKFEVSVIDILLFVDTSNIQKIVFHKFCDEYYSKLLGRVLGGLFWSILAESNLEIRILPRYY